MLGQVAKCSWLQVRTAQKVEGWVAGGSQFVTLNRACSTIAEVRAPAAPASPQLGVDFGFLITLPDVVAEDFPVAKAMGADWSRIELPWLKIEATPGVLDWAVYDAAMKRAQELSVRVLVVIHSPPTWAAKESCGPVTDTAALTRFITAAVKRYRDSAHAWEFINEPDGKAYLPKYGPTIGCWGPAPDQYAQQLAIFYKTVKALSPNTPVLFGSLAFDNWQLFERSFLDNALANGAGNFFDALGLHFYPINPAEFPSIRDKISKVRAILDQHAVGNKQIWITETSMWTNAGANLDAQKEFIVREQTRALCGGAEKLFWFAVRQEGPVVPLNRWLINLQHQPDQGYFTYQHYASQILGRRCQGAVANLPANSEAYRWSAAGKGDLYIVWSNGGTQTITLPANSPATISQRDGGEKQSVAAQNGTITIEVGAQPVFVVLDR